MMYVNDKTERQEEKGVRKREKMNYICLKIISINIG